ncbi:MAG: glycerol-3-phosphate acyltransferase [Candidatus Heimdallarchaeota archaeon]
MAFPDWATYVLLLVGSYLVGSFPTGWVLGKITKGIDIRDFGSGNTGFSNAYRLLGKRAAILTIIGDIVLKGGIVAWAARLIVGLVVINPPDGPGFVYTLGFTEPLPQAIVVGAGIMSVLGHNYPVWLRFKGGKGMATTAGVIVWFTVVFTTRYTSLANIITTPTLPIFIFLEANYIMKLVPMISTLPLIIGGLLAGIFILFRHRDNIKRLLAKEERKFGDKSERIEKEVENSESTKST